MGYTDKLIQIVYCCGSIIQQFLINQCHLLGDQITLFLQVIVHLHNGTVKVSMIPEQTDDLIGALYNSSHIVIWLKFL